VPALTPAIVALADAPGAAATMATTLATSANGDNSAASLSLLLFSPLGYIAFGLLAVVGGLGLWVAFLLGRRGGQQQPKAPAADKDVLDDFTLQSNNKTSAPKT
jgi:hypothetical protein